jgi:hypothetical protein
MHRLVPVAPVCDTYSWRKAGCKIDFLPWEGDPLQCARLSKKLPYGSFGMGGMGGGYSGVSGWW